MATFHSTELKAWISYLYMYWSRPQINVSRKILACRHCSGSTVQNQKNLLRHMSLFSPSLQCKCQSWFHLKWLQKAYDTYSQQHRNYWRGCSASHSLPLRIFEKSERNLYGELIKNMQSMHSSRCVRYLKIKYHMLQHSEMPLLSITNWSI